MPGPLLLTQMSSGTLVPLDISDELASRYGPTISRFRFEKRTKTFGFVADITTAVIKNSGSVSLTNDEEGVMRNVSFSINVNALPETLNFTTDNVAVFYDVLIDDEYWEAYSLGLFRMDYPKERLSSNGDLLWDLEGVDLMVDLLTQQRTEPYLVAAGTDYGTAAHTLVSNRGINSAISAIGKLTPVDFVFDPGKSDAQIANELLQAVNHYPVYIDEHAVARTLERTSPYGRVPAIRYSTEDEPRMLLPGANRMRDTSQPNRIVVRVADPLRFPFAVYAENNDPASEISTVTRGATVQEELDDGRIYNATTAQDVAAWAIYDAVAHARTLEIVTRFDPRRGAHETYELEIETYEMDTRWLVLGWELPLAEGGVMTHTLGYAPNVAVALGTLL